MLGVGLGPILVLFCRKLLQDSSPPFVMLAMPFTIEVSLLSGRSVSLEARPDEPVQSLQSRAQRTLAVVRGRLLSSSGGILDGAATLAESGLLSGDVLTLLMSSIQVCAGYFFFAAILCDGCVVSWGSAHTVHQSLHVRGRLKDVRQIQATTDSFAAILGDGSVVTWGGWFWTGGDSSAVQGQLKDVRLIQASQQAFAAILGSGSVVTWGATAVLCKVG